MDESRSPVDEEERRTFLSFFRFLLSSLPRRLVRFFFFLSPNSRMTGEGKKRRTGETGPCSEGRSLYKTRRPASGLGGKTWSVLEGGLAIVTGAASCPRAASRFALTSFLFLPLVSSAFFFQEDQARPHPSFPLFLSSMQHSREGLIEARRPQGVCLFCLPPRCLSLSLLLSL